MITIINYKMGNLGSIQNMLKKIGEKSIITNDLAVIEKAKKIILPGVGSFDRAMKNLEDLDLIPILNKKILEEKTPVLGICLGMQLLAGFSEEGNVSGLGYIKGKVKKFNFSNKANLKIPHMGWNTINFAKEHKLLSGLSEEPRFYFVHSFYFECQNKEDVLSVTNYGGSFVSSVARDNIMGTQFHPEKSHRFGMQLLNNFVENF